MPRELLDYVSPLKSAAGVVFSVRCRRWEPAPPGRTLVLETIQDPGNLGTILRTANALSVDTVILTGDCADVWNPKTVRATMGAVFRQRFYEMERGEMRDYLARHGLKLYGAALSDRAGDLRTIDLSTAAAHHPDERPVRVAERRRRRRDRDVGADALSGKRPRKKEKGKGSGKTWQVWNTGSGLRRCAACAQKRAGRCWTASSPRGTCSSPTGASWRGWS